MKLIYVDDLSCGAKNVNEAYKMYVKSNLRKFIANSNELKEKVRMSEMPECLTCKSTVDKIIETENLLNYR